MNHNVELQELEATIERYLQQKGFQIRHSKDPSEPPPSWFFIQATKNGILRSISGTRRSTDITIRGNPDFFEVTIGTGEWGKNMLSSIPLLVVAPYIGVPTAMAQVYAGRKFEDDLRKYIRGKINFLKDTALDYYTESLERSRAWNEKGVALLNSGKVAEAVQYFDKAISSFRKNSIAWYNIGVTFTSLKRLREAIACYDKSIEISPNNVDALSRKRETEMMLIASRATTSTSNTANVDDWAVYYSGKDRTSYYSDMYRNIVNNAWTNRW
jgi:tetratricopeptide (TPR) repeat protein